jgi:hypothetical protein
MALTHKEIIEQHEHDINADRVNRDDMIEDMAFSAGDQWDALDKQQRESEQRPCFTINQTGQFIRQVSGDLRQSRPSIVPVPVDGAGDQNLTDIYAGLIRQIEYQSNAQAAYGWGGECAIGYGIGHWRIITDYSYGDTFDQDIRIQRILDPLSVTWDAAATEIDRCDAMHCTVTEMVTEDEYKRRFKKTASSSDYPSPDTAYSNQLYWSGNDNKVRIAEYWERREVDKLLGLTQDGKTLDLTDISPQMFPMLGVARTRKAKGYKVFQHLLDGNDFLQDAKDWAGCHIPIVSVLGNEIPIQEGIIRHGVVRFLKDPQRLYNYWRSVGAEVLSNQPKAPFIGPLGSFAGLEKYWKNANKGNQQFLPYNPDPELPNAGMPTRQPPPAAPTAMWQESTISQGEMHSVVGIYPAALGQRSNETSGKAINARKAESDTGSFVYFDNFATGMRRNGTILVDLIGKIYDGQRTVRILGNDNQEQFVPINTLSYSRDGMPVLVNDISAQKFDVRIDVGPSFTSAREQARDQLGQILTGNPQLMNVIGDIYFGTLDIPDADKLVERMKKVIPPQITGEAEQQPPDPIAIAQQRLAQLGAEAEVKKTEAEASDKAASAEGKQLDNAAKAHQMGIGMSM